MIIDIVEYDKNICINDINLFNAETFYQKKFVTFIHGLKCERCSCSTWI